MVATCVGAVVALTVAVTVAQQNHGATAPGHFITGRVVDPHQLRPEEAILMLGQQDRDGVRYTPIKTSTDGSFITPRLGAGSYVLQIVRNPHSATKPAVVVGFTLVEVGMRDVSGVTVAVRRDTAITGTFRVESDNPNAEWPPDIGVTAFLALDGVPFLGSTGADGAPAGKFVLRNSFGPRVLRCNYSLAPGSRWWPSRVLRNGLDITNIPTDFSAHENGQLEVVFTQHPARIVGKVTNALGEAARAAWILVIGEDRALWQPWATTSMVAEADTMGRFSLVAPLPGRYLVSAVPQAMFDSRGDARRQILRFAPNGVPVDVKERGDATVNLALRSR
jgi:hypothetical protein